MSLRYYTLPETLRLIIHFVLLDRPILAPFVFPHIKFPLYVNVSYSLQFRYNIFKVATTGTLSYCLVFDESHACSVFYRQGVNTIR